MNVTNALARHGKRVPVYKEEVVAQNDFGNPEYEWQQMGTVLTVRSYQNRNTTTATASGELNRDRAMFFFEVDEYPPADTRIEYEGTFYEMDATTEQLTHAATPGSIVRDFNPNN